ncbi:hypothetical protein [Vibrio phage vB_ValS_PJ32]|nr:hypothetical protein [Vibrio phage vB_ValS_PJ32]
MAVIIIRQKTASTKKTTSTNDQPQESKPQRSNPEQHPKIERKSAEPYSKYLANVLESVKNNNSRFIIALGAIFAKNKTDAMRQAQALYTCKAGQRIEVSECLDPFT